MQTNTTKSYSAEQLAWKKIVSQYQKADVWVSVWQVINTFVPFFIIWYLAYLALEISVFLTVPLSILAGLFLVRIFIIQHDCGHGSFFKNRRYNDRVGLFASLFTWTPYFYWQRSHAIHHAHSGDLDHRGIGDVHTKTVKEYLALSSWEKFKYRVYRHPLIMFVIGPTLLFTVFFRFTTPEAKPLRREEPSVHWTNLAILIEVVIMVLLVGWQDFLIVHAPVLITGSSIGTWLFFHQHQYEETYWEHHEDWEYSAAALEGSSFYKLPKVMQWFTGNIGYHHIHHLSPRIPNYRLEQCHEENPMFQDAMTLTFTSSLKSLFLSLWDEEEKRMISFGQLRRQQLLVASASEA